MMRTTQDETGKEMGGCLLRRTSQGSGICTEASRSDSKVMTIRSQGLGTFWLDDFYDRVIPNAPALERIRHYIRTNPIALETREG